LLGALCHRSVSAPRSSNRTCGFPASGSPTGFTARPTSLVARCAWRTARQIRRARYLESIVRPRATGPCDAAATSPCNTAPSEGFGYVQVFPGSSPITLYPHLPPKHAGSQVPSLRRHYPASTVLRTCPTPIVPPPDAAFEVATPARSGLPRLRVLPCQRAVSTTPADPNGCICSVSFPVRCCLPRYPVGSASASLLSWPARTSLALQPAGLLARPRRTLSQGSSQLLSELPVSYSIKPATIEVESSSTGYTHPIGAHWAKARNAPCPPPHCADAPQNGGHARARQASARFAHTLRRKPHRSNRATISTCAE
jgi:hypothetical protein